MMVVMVIRDRGSSTSHPLYVVVEAEYRDIVLRLYFGPHGVMMMDDANLCELVRDVGQGSGNKYKDDARQSGLLKRAPPRHYPQSPIMR